MILSIVILSYNTKDLVLDCISSTSRKFHNELERGEIEIIVVDNASEKEIIMGIEKKLKDLVGVRMIKSQENLGFSLGCNLGVKKALGEFVLFLNSDTKTNDKGFLEMVNFLKANPKTAILGGRLLNSDGSQQPSVGKFYNLANFFIMLFGGEKFGLLRSAPNNIQRVDWVSGACMMVNKKIFENLGGFDKNFFMYMEDMELCYRAKKEGFSTFFYPKTSVFHKELGSSNRTFAVVGIYKGILYFYKKHKSLMEYLIVRYSLLLKAAIVYLLGRLTNNSYYITTYRQALKIFLR